MKMAVFVTGGGFVGYWVVKNLISQGQDVILYDLRPPQLDREDIEKVTFVQGDILQFPRLVEVFHDHKSKIEGIIHTAAITAFFFLDNPYQNTLINIIGTLNILEVARIFKVRRVVYTSSGAVYGDAERASEKKTAISPMNLYGASKASGDLVGLQYANHWKIDFRSARLMFLYGPPVLPSKSHILIKTLFGALEGLSDIKWESGGDHEADFTYIKDAVRGVLLLYQTENIKNRVFNITGGKAYKFSEVLDTVKAYSRPSNIEIGPGYASFPRAGMIDISRAKDELGYDPEYTLEKGVSEYAEWFKTVQASR
jgi:nucleoside-diphosphate-sugar epimerase